MVKLFIFILFFYNNTMYIVIIWLRTHLFPHPPRPQSMHNITEAAFTTEVQTWMVPVLYGSEFWTMYNWPFSDLEHFYYTWFAPSYSETISLGVIVKSAIRAFRKHILYIPLLVFVHHTGLQMPKNDKKWSFYTFFICSEPSCKFSSYITDII